MRMEVKLMAIHKRGDLLTDWSQAATFYVAKVGKAKGSTVLMDEAGALHQAANCTPCGEPPPEQWRDRYDGALSGDELATLVVAVEEELAGDADELTQWLSLLSEQQKRQVWMALHPHTREEIRLAAKLSTSKEVA
jgi:hypothetical protein